MRLTLTPLILPLLTITSLYPILSKITAILSPITSHYFPLSPIATIVRNISNHYYTITIVLLSPFSSVTRRSLVLTISTRRPGEFQRLGASVIHANVNTMTISTRQNNVADAVAYVEYATNAIRGKDLFRLIHIGYRQSWRVLAWLDTVSGVGL